MTNYQIQRGDTLSALARRFGTSVGALMEANPQITNANLIYTGQSLNLPGSQDSFEPAPPAGGGQYTVLTNQAAHLEPQRPERAEICDA